MVMQQMVMMVFFSLNKRPVAVSAPAGHTGWQLKVKKDLGCISLDVQLVLTWRWKTPLAASSSLLKTNHTWNRTQVNIVPVGRVFSNLEKTGTQININMINDHLNQQHCHYDLLNPHSESRNQGSRLERSFKKFRVRNLQKILFPSNFVYFSLFFQQISANLKKGGLSFWPNWAPWGDEVAKLSLLGSRLVKSSIRALAFLSTASFMNEL